MPTAPEAIITLNCFVLGGDSWNIFCVDIDQTETVGTLKDLIKNQMPIAFRNVDANNLVLWKAPESLLCESNTFKEMIDCLNLQDEKCLHPVKKLSRIFSYPESEYLHIIIKAPVFMVLCWIRGQPTTSIHQFNISRAETVRTLKTLIRKSPEAAISPEVQTIQLYKLKNPVPSPYHKNLKNVTLAEMGEPLQSIGRLSRLFVAPPVERHIHIIVDTPYPVIHCWLRGEEVENSFGIRISADARISLLIEQIKVTQPDLSVVVDNRIHLYKVSANDNHELQESLRSLGAGHRLDGRRVISTSFLDVPVLQDYCVIVEVAPESK
ncbi:hypothetical protein PAXRUDRAFT_492504 [Paxillus rubicundulus Ve08.2h10]|uniref:Crinkler effector protein N-terminal domain-containing protein n=1 Tax=Paxillus rubicundulus Ve08.2h10 TaxID=930991 RepID=A0A0D0BVL5_9AGAM|nr:hypothetical protein PAXRUDRAFT_492504 [Paxillus rubicundulus Ve08.2h10]